MKKIVLIILIVIYFSCNLNAGPFVKAEAGPSINIPGVYFVESVIGFKFKFWEFESQTYGGWLTWADTNGNIARSNPFMEVYSLNQKFIYKKVFIHYRHYCAHPVTNGTEDAYTEKGTLVRKFRTSPYWWAGTMETVSIGFEYEWK